MSSIFFPWFQSIQPFRYLLERLKAFENCFYRALSSLPWRGERESCQPRNSKLQQIVLTRLIISPLSLARPSHNEWIHLSTSADTTVSFFFFSLSIVVGTAVKTKRESSRLRQAQTTCADVHKIYIKFSLLCCSRSFYFFKNSRTMKNFSTLSEREKGSEGCNWKLSTSLLLSHPRIFLMSQEI